MSKFENSTARIISHIEMGLLKRQTFCNLYLYTRHKENIYKLKFLVVLIKVTYQETFTAENVKTVSLTADKHATTLIGNIVNSGIFAGF